MVAHRRRNALLLTSALAGISLCGLSAGVALAAPPDATYQFDIPAESLSQALTDFSQNSPQQIIFSEDAVKGIKTQGVHGKYSSADALRILLSGTDLKVEVNAAGVLMVRSKNVQAASNEAAPASDNIETVVVTGTNIRGVTNPTSPTMVIDATELQRSGYTTTQDVIASIPQNFGGGSNGPSADGALGAGANGGNNIEGGTAINLRGLGATSTLTLLNGHRLAPSAFGGFVDISSIPLLAIDRIEIVSDGASAIYGSDAVAGVANIILKKDFDGAETDVEFGTVTNGGLQQHTIAQLAGKQWDSGGLMGVLQYQDSGALPTTARSFTATSPQPTNIFNPYVKYSGIFEGHEDITSDLEAFGDAFINHDNTSSVQTYAPGANHTFDEFVDSQTENYHGGLRYRPFGDWELELADSYSGQTTSYGFNQYPGTIALGVRGHYTDTMNSVDFNATGTLFSWAGGDVKLAVGGSDRTEHARNAPTPVTAVTHGFSRSVLSEYGELYVPIVGEANELPFVHSLTLSAALRHDHYSDFGDTTNPKVGVLWGVTPGLNIRGSWGSAFRAPSAGELLLQQNYGPLIYTYPFSNPSGPGTIPIFVTPGANPLLKPETAHTWTLGFDLQPEILPGVKLSADYYDVDYTNRIVQPPFATNALLFPNVYGSLISTFSSDAQAAAYLANFLTQPGAQFFDLAHTGSTGIRYLYTAQLQNAASVRQSGFDVQGEYDFTSGQNAFSFNANLAIIDEIRTQLAAGATPIDIVNTYSNPLRFRMRDQFSWSRGEWQITAALNYSNSYTDTVVTPTEPISAFTTMDLNLQYTPSWLPGLTAIASATNLFDTSPPFASGGGLNQSGINYDVGNASPLGRFISFELKKTW